MINKYVSLRQKSRVQAPKLGALLVGMKDGLEKKEADYEKSGF